MGSSSSSANDEHETFNVDKLFSTSGALDMREVTMVLWRNRENANLVQVLTEMMGKFSDEKTVFDAMEFYLPQLAHMLIHMEQDLPSSALENFVLIACQQSIHMALLLEWCVTGALEDYAPELENGEKNSNFNERYFSRCAKLSQDIERCVVYGNFQNPTLEDMYRRGYVNKKEFSELEIADRRYAAIQLANARNPGRCDMAGTLWCKRGENTREEERTGRKHKWMRRHLEIRDRMLFCYRTDHKKTLKRAVNLDNAAVRIISSPEYENYFELLAESGGTTVVYHLRTDSKEEMDKWVTSIRQWAEAPPRPGDSLIEDFTKAVESCELPENPHPSMSSLESEAEASEEKKSDYGGLSSVITGANGAANGARGHTRTWSKAEHYKQFKLTHEQAERYDFYHNQRAFIRSLTSICEDLRFIEPEEREEMLEHKLKDVVIPEPCYLPLCKSSDAWARVLRITPKDHHAFSTRARCPCLVTFEVALEEDFVDVANFLHQRFGAPVFRMEEDPETRSSVAPSEQSEGLSSVIGGALNIGSETLTNITSIIGINSNGSETSDDPTNVSTVSEPPMRAPSTADTASLNGAHSVVGADSIRATTSRRKKRPDVWRSVKRSPDDSARWSLDLKQLAKKVRGGRRRRAQSERARMSLQSENSMDRSREDNFDVLAGTMEPWRRQNSAPPETMPEDIRYRAYQKVSYGEAAYEKRARIFEESPQKDTPGWDLVGVIFKSNDDLRQEVFIMQLITFYRAAWKAAGCSIWTFTYRILSTSQMTGCIQVVPNAISLDALKKREDYGGSLDSHFLDVYGSDPSALRTAKLAFAASLAGYSLLQYLLLIKDRHNGNIMLDAEGHLIHIDFGFVLGIAPGKAFSMELSAPFKLTPEYIEVLGGQDGEAFQEFRQALIDGLIVARKHGETVECLMEIMAFKSRFPCFQYAGSVAPLQRFRRRLRLDLSDDMVPALVDSLIYKSMHHRGTIYYDKFQTWSNGIAQ